MIKFNIERPDENISDKLIDKINNLTKPKGSLGRLEEIARQIGLIQQTLSPKLSHPINVIYASDHGIADEGVSLSPKEVTRQVVYNFLNGGAGVCYLARQHGFEIKIVDGGVDYDFPENPRIINRKIRKGTRNFLYEAAMTYEEMEKALEYLNRSAHAGNESAALALTRMANNQFLAVATNVLDLVGSLASIESYRQPQDCTTMPISRKERKKHEWEQSM